MLGLRAEGLMTQRSAFCGIDEMGCLVEGRFPFLLNVPQSFKGVELPETGEVQSLGQNKQV